MQTRVSFPYPLTLQSAMQQDALDLDDGMGSHPVPAKPYLDDATGWITETDGTFFAQGSEGTNHFAKADAYRALTVQDTVRAFLGLDVNLGEVATADVRSQPIDEDHGYPTSDPSGHVPDMIAVVRHLLHYKDLFLASHMVFLIVDNRTPSEVARSAFASWRSSRRKLIGPQEERTEVLWICADRESGLRDVPYYWAGVFVLEAARFLFPRQHFGLIDNDCVPVTMFESQDLVSLATNQHQWVDLVGHARTDHTSSPKLGVILFAEAHLEYNAGLVLFLGSSQQDSPFGLDSTAETLASELLDYRRYLLATVRPPINRSNAALDFCSLPC